MNGHMPDDKLKTYNDFSEKDFDTFNKIAKSDIKEIFDDWFDEPLFIRERFIEEYMEVNKRLNELQMIHTFLPYLMGKTINEIKSLPYIDVTLLKKHWFKLVEKEE